MNIGQINNHELNPMFKRAASLNGPIKQGNCLSLDTVQFSGQGFSQSPKQNAVNTFVDYLVERLRQILIEANDAEMDQAYLKMFDDKKMLKRFKETTVQCLMDGEQSTEDIEYYLAELKLIKDAPHEQLNILLMVEALNQNFVVEEMMRTLYED